MNEQHFKHPVKLFRLKMFERQICWNMKGEKILIHLSLIYLFNGEITKSKVENVVVLPYWCLAFLIIRFFSRLLP